MCSFSYSFFVVHGDMNAFKADGVDKRCYPWCPQHSETRDKCFYGCKGHPECIFNQGPCNLGKLTLKLGFKGISLFIILLVKEKGDKNYAVIAVAGVLIVLFLVALLLVSVAIFVKWEKISEKMFYDPNSKQ